MIWPRVAKNRGLSFFLPRVFTEPRSYPLFRFSNCANPSLFIIFSLAKLSATTVPSVRIRPLHRRKGSSHRRATVQPSLRPPSRHRRSSVAASCAPSVVYSSNLFIYFENELFLGSKRREEEE